MKDYLYYLFDEKLSGEGLSSVKERISATGAKVIDLSPTKKGIMKRLKELKGSKKYALLIGNDVETQHIALKAEVDFCGWLDGTTSEAAFQQLPYRKLLNDIRLLPLMRQRYPYQHKGKIGWMLMKYSRWVHFKQIRGLTHKAKYSVQEHVCQNCGETYTGNFCPSCGQKHNVKRYEMATLLKDTISDAINFEHGFLRSFLELCWRPGYMMRDIIDGKRKDYNKPIKTIFVLATVYLIAAQLLDPASFVKRKEVNLESIPAISQKLAEDTLNNDIVPQLFEINKLASEALAIKREQTTSRNLVIADSILKRRHSSLSMNKEDSILIMRQIMSAMNKADSVKFSEMLKENASNMGGVWGDFTNLAARNTEVLEKFEERYYHEGTLLYSMGEILKDFFDMNKAVAILLMIPVMVFCARRSFRTTLVGMRMNLAEYIMVFMIFGTQLMWLQLLLLFVTQTSSFAPTYDMGAGILLLAWDMKQLFNLGWRNSLKRTIFYMYAYGILFVLLATAALSVLSSFVMWIMYQITL